MPDLEVRAEAVSGEVLSALEQQIDELQAPSAFAVELASLSAEVAQFGALLAALPVHDATIDATVSTTVRPTIAGVLDGTLPRVTLAKLLAELYTLEQTLGTTMDAWIGGGKVTIADREKARNSLLRIIAGAKQLLTSRPDVKSVMDDLEALKELRGGPADATAFHDFHCLQVAFKHVWLHAFDGSLRTAAEELYQTLITDKILGYDSASLPPPEDVKQLQDLLAGLRYRSPDPIPGEVAVAFGDLAVRGWPRLSEDQQHAVLECARVATRPYFFGILLPGQVPPPPPKEQMDAKANGIQILEAAIKQPQSGLGRLTDLIETINQILREKYAFDVFAPGSYNYGLMSTYRQIWEPDAYQAGDLVATIPLAPGEIRKFTRRHAVKKTRAEKEIEKAMSSRALQSSEISRAEQDIMQRATTATNFKMTASGSFNIGVGSIQSTTEFGGNQEAFSSSTKRSFHEATLKAAEEYRLERSMEIDTTTSEETEETSSGEISNPNNEITVTYLFYELQRRYKIREFLYRVRPVILVAQDVPSPDEIDEAWLLQHQWIIARVLLDDSFRPALSYLSSGFAGDELAVAVRKTHWETQRRLVETLESSARSQMASRDSLRELLVTTQLQKDAIPDMPGALKIFTLGMDPGDAARDMLDASIKAFETRLGYAESALADAQEKLKQATSAFDAATKDYSAALQNQFNRRVAIDQLRVHVKDNILYYMQAIWDQENPDQRFFRLYTQKVICPKPEARCRPTITGKILNMAPSNPRALQLSTTFRSPLQRIGVVDVTDICVPSATLGGDEHELVEVADLDSPLGYKGNYIIFPLKHGCALTDCMLSHYIDNHLGLIDADRSDSFVPEEFDARWEAAKDNEAERTKLRQELIDYVTAARRSTDEIIVPTGQMFIEALPGSHPLLEDFKLLHRSHDVRKVKAEVRRAELENLRLASRLAAAHADATANKVALLSDPDVDKLVVVGDGKQVSVDT
jgi:hypothetical protein